MTPFPSPQAVILPWCVLNIYPIGHWANLRCKTANLVFAVGTLQADPPHVKGHTWAKVTGLNLVNIHAFKARQLNFRILEPKLRWSLQGGFQSAKMLFNILAPNHNFLYFHTWDSTRRWLNGKLSRFIKIGLITFLKTLVFSSRTNCVVVLICRFNPHRRFVLVPQCVAKCKIVEINVNNGVRQQPAIDEFFVTYQM